MDLNAKIAARRKEIEKEKEVAAQESASAQEVDWIQQVAMRQRGISQGFDAKIFNKELERRARKELNKDVPFIVLGLREVVWVIMGLFIESAACT